MWICQKCNEENEDSFDTCYKCQTFSEEGASKSKEHQKELEKEQSDTVINNNPPSIKNRFLYLLPGLFVFVCFFSAYGFPLHTNPYYDTNSLSRSIHKNYDRTETFKAVFSNTVKSWMPNYLEQKAFKYREDLDKHYYIEKSNDKFEYYLMSFASFLPYLMIVSLIILWVKRISSSRE